MTRSLLSARNLQIDLVTESTQLRAVDGVDYDVAAGETLAIVGESGSGKTIMNLAPLGLLPTGVAISTKGTLDFGGLDLLSASEEQLRKVRGGQIGVIFQDPMSALNPARRIGRQVAEVAELHLGMSVRAAEARALDLLKMVGVSDPEARLRQYPHELSGGLRQRVMIASAVAAEPKLLIADEPTTALDVTIQAQILRLIADLQARLGMAMVLITHDIGVVASVADQVAVMYAGRIVEYGDLEGVLKLPQHPYTQGLIGALPRREDRTGAPFRGLAGLPPILGAPIRGCPFAPRCDLAVETCTRQRPLLLPAPSGRSSAACSVLTALPLAS